MIEIVKDKYAVDSDPNCVSVHKRRWNKKTEEFEWYPKWYFSDYKQALAGLLNRGIVGGGKFENFKDMVEAIKNCESAIIEAIESKLTGKEERCSLNVPIS